MVCVLAYLYLKEAVDIFLYRFAQGNIYVCAALCVYVNIRTASSTVNRGFLVCQVRSVNNVLAETLSSVYIIFLSQMSRTNLPCVIIFQ